MDLHEILEWTNGAMNEDNMIGSQTIVSRSSTHFLAAFTYDGITGRCTRAHCRGYRDGKEYLKFQIRSVCKASEYDVRRVPHLSRICRSYAQKCLGCKTSGNQYRLSHVVHNNLLKENNVSTALEDENALETAHAHLSETLWISILRQADAFYRFTRPHTIIGTVIGVTSVSLLSVDSITDISLKFFLGLLQALLPAVCMNIYVVGLNQLFDIDIDKVNKPRLPLASGEFSMETGIMLVVAFGVMSFAMGIKSRSPPLLTALLISSLLGSAYSIKLPLLRWKENAFLGAACILSVRAITLQLAFFLHMKRYVLGRTVTFSKPLAFSTVFMCFFAATIALFKDIPDVDGDKRYGIQSFSVRLGQEKVFWLCIKILLTTYFSAMIVGFSAPNIWKKFILVLGHGLLAFELCYKAQSINIQNKASISSFYMFIWKLFYTEYFLIPFLH